MRNVVKIIIKRERNAFSRFLIKMYVNLKKFKEIIVMSQWFRVHKVLFLLRLHWFPAPMSGGSQLSRPSGSGDLPSTSTHNHTAYALVSMYTYTCI